MDLDLLISEYKAWLIATPKVTRVLYGSPQVSKTVLTPQLLWNAVEEGFSAGNSLVSVNKIINTDSTDGLLMWYNQVFLPAQG